MDFGTWFLHNEVSEAPVKEVEPNQRMDVGFLMAVLLRYTQSWGAQELIISGLGGSVLSMLLTFREPTEKWCW